MTKKTRNRLIVFCILAFPFLVLFGFWVSQVAQPLPPISPLPNLNGYDDFAKAGEMVSTNTWDYNKMNEEKLRKTVSGNAEALSLVRSGLSNQCRVPIQFSETYISNHLNDLADLKRLAEAFCAEGKLVEMGNRPDDAAKSYLDAVHFGNESARGGVLIDEMVGIAIEAIGTSRLTNLVDRLGAKSCRETAAALETLDSQRQSWNEVMQQEHNWSRRTFNSLQYKIHRSFLEKMNEPVFRKTKEKFQQQQIKTRQLIIDLAARAYELDKGKQPANISDLVPDYLNAIPQDLFTGTNMVYSSE